MSLAGDVLDIHFEGVICLSDSVLLRQVFDEIYRERGPCFLVADMRRATGIDRDARQYMKEWSKVEPIQLLATAVYGVSFAVRAISILMINAIKMLGKRHTEVVFLKDETEARRWIDAQRAAHKEGSHGGR